MRQLLYLPDGKVPRVGEALSRADGPAGDAPRREGRRAIRATPRSVAPASPRPFGQAIGHGRSSEVLRSGADPHRHAWTSRCRDSRAEHGDKDCGADRHHPPGIPERLPRSRGLERTYRSTSGRAAPNGRSSGAAAYDPPAPWPARPAGRVRASPAGARRRAARIAGRQGGIVIAPGRPPARAGGATGAPGGWGRSGPARLASRSAATATEREALGSHAGWRASAPRARSPAARSVHDVPARVMACGSMGLEVDAQPGWPPVSRCPPAAG